MNITVYSKPNCVMCDATYRKLDQLGAMYDTVDVSVDADALTHITRLGFQQAPVVVLSDGTSWSGYRPDMIKRAVTAQESATADLAA